MAGQARVNQTSIRYSDEVKNIVDGARGNTFGDKFEYIVLNYLEEKSAREDKLNYLDRCIASRSDELKNLSEAIRKYEKLLPYLQDLFFRLENM